MHTLGCRKKKNERGGNMRHLNRCERGGDERGAGAGVVWWGINLQHLLSFIFTGAAGRGQRGLRWWWCWWWWGIRDVRTDKSLFLWLLRHQAQEIEHRLLWWWLLTPIGELGGAGMEGAKVWPLAPYSDPSRGLGSEAGPYLIGNIFLSFRVENSVVGGELVYCTSMKHSWVGGIFFSIRGNSGSVLQ